MTQPQRLDLATKDAILKVLTDEETARVSTVEAAMKLHDGAEYIDLEHLDKGVQISNSAAHSTAKSALTTIIPKSAISKESWQKIVAYITR